MADSTSDEEALDVQATARLVLTNWLHELKAAWGPMLLSGGPETIVEVTPEALTVFREEADRSEIAGRVPVEGGKADIRVLRTLVEQAGQGQNITLRLPADAALRPRLTLPNAGYKALRGALAYEIERISPISPAELYYDYSIVGRSGALADIELRLVKRQLLDGQLTTCRAAGLSVEAIGFVGDPRSADWRSFPVDRAAHLRTLFQRYRRLGLIAVTMILFGAVLIGAYARQVETLDAAVAASAEAGQRAARVEKLQHTIASASKDMGFAAEQKRSPLLVAILAELTQSLPDGTWVNELTFDGKTVRMTGSSAAAADLIGLIDRSPKFGSARFEAPIVHDQATNTDRFDLSFTVRGR